MTVLERIIKDLKITQNDLAGVLGKSQTAISKVKKGEMAFPLEWKELIKKAYNINVDDYELENNHIVRGEGIVKYTKQEAKQVPDQGFQMADFLPIEAQAGYLDGLESQTVQELDQMLIPKEFEKGSYLIVEISGDSMNDGSARAIQDGDKLLVKELQKHHWKNKLHYKQYLFIIMSREGVVCKQVTGHDIETGQLTCHSWNDLYKDYTVNLEDVYKLFYVKKIVERRIKF